MYWNLASRTSPIVCLQFCYPMSLQSLTILPSIEPFPIIIFNLGLTPIGVFHLYADCLSTFDHQYEPGPAVCQESAILQDGFKGSCRREYRPIEIRKQGAKVLSGAFFCLRACQQEEQEDRGSCHR